MMAIKMTMMDAAPSVYPSRSNFNCGKTGRDGPSNGECQQACQWPRAVTVIGIQSWTVPFTVGIESKPGGPVEVFL